MSGKTFYFILKVKLSKLKVVSSMYYVVWVEHIWKAYFTLYMKPETEITYLLQPVKSQVLHSWMCSNACSFNPSSLQGFTSPPRSSAHNVMRVRLPIPHTALQFDQRDHCISQGSTPHSSLFSADPSHDFGLTPLKKENICMISFCATFFYS